MPWDVTYLQDLRVVQTTYVGQVPAAELREAFDMTLSMVQRHNTLHILADCRELTGGHTATNLFDLVQQMDASQLSRQFREAVLLPAGKNTDADVEFWATSCRNRGFNVRIFDDRAAALAWLTGPPLNNLFAT